MDPTNIRALTLRALPAPASLTLQDWVPAGPWSWGEKTQELLTSTPTCSAAPSVLGSTLQASSNRVKERLLLPRQQLDCTFREQ